MRSESGLLCEGNYEYIKEGINGGGLQFCTEMRVSADDYKSMKQNILERKNYEEN